MSWVNCHWHPAGDFGKVMFVNLLSAFGWYWRKSGIFAPFEFYLCSLINAFCVGQFGIFWFQECILSKQICVIIVSHKTAGFDRFTKGNFNDFILFLSLPNMFLVKYSSTKDVSTPLILYCLLPVIVGNRIRVLGLGFFFFKKILISWHISTWNVFILWNQNMKIYTHLLLPFNCLGLIIFRIIDPMLKQIFRMKSSPVSIFLCYKMASHFAHTISVFIFF